MTNFRTPLRRKKSARIPLRDKINVAYTLVIPAYRRAVTPFTSSATDPLWEEDENYTRDYTTRDFTPPLHRIYATLPSTVSIRSRLSRRRVVQRLCLPQPPFLVAIRPDTRYLLRSPQSYRYQDRFGLRCTATSNLPRLSARPRSHNHAFCPHNAFNIPSAPWSRHLMKRRPLI